ncbi:unnamed protein product [Diatraea saccharalis]|uniref:Acyltransferase 3 domain-containing protein n=1 Tax=Diatraea saccharalis TaxID=40085 RepID=A0A9N9WCM1_9NEOP|nr:unnamed protein product [Diatraea saccharalis]
MSKLSNGSGIKNPDAMDNPCGRCERVDTEAQRVLGWLVLHDDLLVDTFFLISAFLTAKALFEFRTLPSIPLMIFRRYIRLVIGLAVVVFFMAAAFDHTGSGPLWNRFSDDEVAACRDNWWLNLLMLSNYIKSGHMCLVMTWYIPCDFHFFVITVIVFALYKRCPTLGMIIACVLAAASIIIPGVINYINKLHAIQLFTYDFLSNPRGNRQFNIMYIKSHTRAAAYIVGLFAGYLFVKYKLKETVKFSQKKSLMYICAALTVMVFITFLGVSYQLRGYSELEGNLYAALNRPIWAAGVVLIILTCAFGKVRFDYIESLMFRQRGARRVGEWFPEVVPMGTPQQVGIRRISRPLYHHHQEYWNIEEP